MPTAAGATRAPSSSTQATDDLPAARLIARRDPRRAVCACQRLRLSFLSRSQWFESLRALRAELQRLSRDTSSSSSSWLPAPPTPPNASAQPRAAAAERCIPAGCWRGQSRPADHGRDPPEHQLAVPHRGAGRARVQLQQRQLRRLGARVEREVAASVRRQRRWRRTSAAPRTRSCRPWCATPS